MSNSMMIVRLVIGSAWAYWASTGNKVALFGIFALLLVSSEVQAFALRRIVFKNRLEP